ncbi:hypothetical protein [Scytonema sp. PRP1]|uniref:hypothetical protein n=1 Tax=Scytonema sp. PRP1 TaxID=3120513 RepID=UPI002FD6D162
MLRLYIGYEALQTILLPSVLVYGCLLQKPIAMKFKPQMDTDGHRWTQINN